MIYRMKKIENNNCHIHTSHIYGSTSCSEMLNLKCGRLCALIHFFSFTVYMYLCIFFLLGVPRPRGPRGDEHHLHAARALELRRLRAARPL